jgi:predicted amidohydrolase
VSAFSARGATIFDHKYRKIFKFSIKLSFIAKDINTLTEPKLRWVDNPTEKTAEIIELKKRGDLHMHFFKGVKCESPKV